MTARGKFVSDLNAWEWPASLNGFTRLQKKAIVQAAWKVATAIVPREEWIKDWHERPEVARLIAAQPGREDA